jgi:CheY-like chemotaxis protein
MAPQTPLHVLVVDDEPGILRGLTRLLQRDGHSVESATDGHAALALLEEGGCDLILCDLRMPTLDGQTFYGLLQQQHPTLCQRLIFMTGDTLGVDSQAFLAQCGLPWIAKPCRIEEIRAAITRVLSAPVHDTPVSTHSHDLHQPFTLAELQAWIDTTKQKRLDLHRLAAEPASSRKRDGAFLDLAALLQEGLEEVRVISASLREESQMVRGAAADLQAYSTQLLEQCTKSIAHMAQFFRETQEKHEAERRLLAMSKST